MAVASLLDDAVLMRPRPSYPPLRVLVVSTLYGMSCCWALATVAGAAPSRAPVRTPSRPSADSSAPVRQRAPARRSESGAPLNAAQPGIGVDESAGQASHPEADPLVSNGLGSPTCRSGVEVELAPASRSHCETSGFMAAAAPTDNYGLDVHIDTGLLPLSGGNLLSTVQSMLVVPEWLGLVWLVHALVVMLEWAFALDILEPGPSTGLAAGLARAQATLTAPLLALALSVAAVLVGYHGLVRRRVAETLGETVLMLAMVGAGLWLMLDPSGTVGALSRWSDSAALGTLAVAAQGSPAAPGRVLGSNLSGIFAAAIQSPWCYLEFGNVGWCRSADALDPTLRSAGEKIAASELAQAGCGESTGACRHGTTAAALATSARLLREARTNGALFLALPPNGPARNSINDPRSLLRVLCRTSDATSCTGPGAAEAQFRTNAGTWPRVTGLLLISVGLLGMMLLFGYVALRLLTAAVLSLAYLLLLPAVVLAPALGERGRALFRAWAGRLFGALLAKLVFAFLLGVLFAVMGVVQSLEAIGWWAQWLLLSAFWWAAFLRRHQLLALPSDVISDARRAASSRRVRAIRETLDTTRQAGEWRERLQDRKRRARSADADRSLKPSGSHPSGAPFPEQRSGSHQGKPVADSQTLRSLEVEDEVALQELGAAQARLAKAAPRLERIEKQRRAAEKGGDARRAARLGVRRDRLALEVEADEGVITRTSLLTPGPGATISADRAAERSRFLDLQTALPAASATRGASGRRDYPALAGVAYRSRAEYERLAPGPQRAVRLEIDRELAARRSAIASRSAGTSARGEVAPLRARLDDSARPHGAETSAIGRRARVPLTGATGSSLGDGRSAPAGEESPVMKDARAVAEGRKRQLGIGRP
ncbi:MAG: hypothetical protein JWM60_2160 [Solirubrobacterales bacterium]|nr:hypothetical protein [Solirubrobacterales bacterium]